MRSLLKFFLGLRLLASRRACAPLGRPGHGELISIGETGSQTYERAVRLYGKDVKSKKPAEGSKLSTESVSADVNGSIDALFNGVETLTMSP